MKRCFSPIFVLSAMLPVLCSCTCFRALKWGMADALDAGRFVQDTVSRGGAAFRFVEQPANKRVLDTLHIVYRHGRAFTLGEWMRQTRGGSALLVLHGDTVVYEDYVEPYARDVRSCVFSVSKSLTALLCDVAVREGKIRSVDDAVTDYVPELKDCDPMFGRLTIRHLLDMRAGFDFDENYSFNPFSKMARLYYRTNSMKSILGAGFRHAPGERYGYNSLTTALLGVVIERAVGMPFARYMSEKVWRPLGMEYDATVALDGRRHRVAKAYGGISACARDLAKVARLYVSRGNWHGRQIVDTAWVDVTAHGKPYNEGYSHGFYTMQWMLRGDGGGVAFADSLSVARRFDATGVPADSRKYIEYADGTWSGLMPSPHYYMLGLYGQVVFICPENGYVLVRLGENKGDEYQLVFDSLAALMP